MTFEQKQYPRVTEILGALKNPILEAWKMREIRAMGVDAFEKMNQETLDIGSCVHKVAECMAKGEVLPIVPEKFSVPVNNGIQAFKAFLSDNTPKFIENEMSVVHEQLRYRGTFDAIAKIQGKITLIDFKTSKDIYDEYFTQLVAYWKAYELMTGNKLEQAMILRLPKDKPVPEVKFLKVDQIDSRFTYFCKLLDIIHINKRKESERW